MATRNSTTSVNTQVIVGQRFGSLVVVERRFPATGRHVHWICRCDCGHVRDIAQPDLRRHVAPGCGRCHQVGVIAPDTKIIGADGHDWSWAFVVFRDIPDFEGYCVGSNGTVWSRRSRNGRGALKPFWRLCMCVYQSGGYPALTFYNEVGSKQFKIHTLVLTLFVGPSLPGMECCHRDDVRTNNDIRNLRWDTPKGNAADRTRNGRGLEGERHPMTRITKVDVVRIRERVAAGEYVDTVASEYGLHFATGYRIVQGKVWRSAGGPMKPPGKRPNRNRGDK
jgi:hypothetical protein